MRAWTLPLVFGIAVAVLGAAVLALNAAGSTEPPAGVPAQPAHPQQLYACAAPSDALSFCQYMSQQMARRNQLSKADYQSAIRAGLDIPRVVRAALPIRHDHCVPAAPAEPGAPCRVVPDPGEPLDPQHVEQALLTAGYQDAVVRLAASEDPVPRGALLYAVPLGNACIIGYQNLQTGTGAGSQGVVGTLPDHTCLSP
ncbi:hypothetical protein Raf01_97430 [Rugosimonospora africana]|uniref:Uncharacterized protein n=2 Tax=Rugosimonospora africana TaxID=556532 RepID=A0A8J3R3G6_9ACTN|nr:hypothetical protein Raf01_97430 [Rugosimonospora africana]